MRREKSRTEGEEERRRLLTAVERREGGWRRPLWLSSRRAVVVRPAAGAFGRLCGRAKAKAVSVDHLVVAALGRAAAAALGGRSLHGVVVVGRLLGRLVVLMDPCGTYVVKAGPL